MRDAMTSTTRRGRMGILGLAILASLAAACSGSGAAKETDQGDAKAAAP